MNSSEHGASDTTAGITRFVTGPLETNTYVLDGANGTALLFDPSSGCADVLKHCTRHRMTVSAIVLTHGHFDHLLGIAEVQQRVGGVDVYVHPEEKVLVSHSEYNGSDMLGLSYAYKGPVRELHEGEMTIAGTTLRVLHVPGHSPGGCAFLWGDQLIAGDTLFAGSIGRADLPGGDYEQLIASIKGKLLPLPPTTVVWPGHGNRTTIGREARLNPFLV
jgi:glyoxylase-like metal-dependent hydrolase (beta-lactamase superfamily II)